MKLKLRKLIKRMVTKVAILILAMIALLGASSMTMLRINAESDIEEKNDTVTALHTVKRGDTLSKLAKKYDTSVFEIMRLNNLRSDFIVVGQRLIVSKAEPYNNRESIKNKLYQFGKFTITGMPYKEYWDTQQMKWEEILPQGEPNKVNLDLLEKHTYEDLEDMMIELAKYEGVRLYKIGESKEGRNIYSLMIDMESDISLENGEVRFSEDFLAKKVLLSTGQIHAREFAGSLFILKEISELLEADDSYIQEVLKNVIYITVPCVNPDGREAIINGGSSDKKSNGNGVDLNRNFPSLNSGQLVKGATLSKSFSTKLGSLYFGGYTLGSEKETKTLMKWMDTFVPEAESLIDYHQQGGGTYSRRDWDTNENQERYIEYASNLRKHLNQKVSKNKYKVLDGKFEGLVGTGGTITDYAASIAIGADWSISYGRLVLNNLLDEEVPLMVYHTLDYTSDDIPNRNSDFVAVTLEICRSKASLGYKQRARKLIAEEYNKYNYGELTMFRAELALGQELVSLLRDKTE